MLQCVAIEIDVLGERRLWGDDRSQVTTRTSAPLCPGSVGVVALGKYPFRRHSSLVIRHDRRSAS
jgi:hypothetical protein